MIRRPARKPATDPGTDPGAVATALASLADDGEGGSRAEAARVALLIVGRSARTAGVAAVTGGRWLAQTLVETAPKLPIRSRETLLAQHPGLDVEHVAQALIASSVKAAMGVGIAGGAIAAVQWTAPPTLLTAPAQLAAETLAIAVIEIKLIAELHELYGVPAPGNARERGLAYLAAWTDRKGLDPRRPSSTLAGLGGAFQRRLRRRVLGRLGRNVTTMGPLLTGAVLGGAMNRHETKTLAGRIHSDVRGAAALSVVRSLEPRRKAR